MLNDFDTFFGCKFTTDKSSNATIYIATLPNGVLGIGTDEPPFQGPPKIDGMLGGYFEPNGADPINFGSKTATEILEIVRKAK